MPEYLDNPASRRVHRTDGHAALTLADVMIGTGGVECTQNLSATPDAAGVLLRCAVEVPAFDVACYFAPMQKYDPFGKANEDLFPDGANRCQPLAMTDWRDLKRGGMFLLLRIAPDDYLAILPLAGGETMAWLEGQDGRLVLAAGTLGTAGFAGDVPLCAWARSKDLYAACEQAWQAAVEHPLIGRSTRLRRDKHYPAVFSYLGWCSWEQYHGDIDEGVLVEAVRRIEASGIPIRYVLIDDGHLHEGMGAEKGVLKGLDPNAEKFPNGWGPVLATRDPGKVRWMGLWLNFNGYWGGVSPENDLGELNAYLEPVPAGALQPKEDLPSATGFFDAMVGRARQAGFDFIKVDNQSAALKFLRGTAHPVRAATNRAKALEAACALHMDGLINCMAHNQSCVMNTRCSAVTRCSEDYKVDDAWRAKSQLFNAYGNVAWLGQTAWCDHDMFHSCDRFAGEIMARAKALSGGPVYLSDAPASLEPAYIRPLCYEDGLLLRPLAPAAPLPESLFIDPYAEPKPFRVIAPLAGRCAAVGLYNLTEPSVSVTASVEPGDYTHAGAMMQDGRPTWSLPAEGLLLVDWKSGQARRLDEPHAVTLPGFGDALVLLCPIVRGWATVGRLDKYLSPAAVEVLAVSDDELLLRMHETGPLTIWRADGEVRCDKGPAEATGDGLWRIDLPAGGRDAVLRLNV